MFVRLIILFALIDIALKSSAQDIHFSQFFNSPINLNPALTGQFNGDYRFVGNYRNQWQSVTTPYRTIGLSADVHNLFQKNNIHSGIAIYNDKTGDSRFGTFLLNVSGAYSISVSSDSNQFITVGIQTGFTQRSINYSALNFDKQYNGIAYDPNLTNGEEFINDGRTWINLNTGIAYTYFISSRNTITSGLSFSNLTAPKQTFFTNNDIKLDRRILLHGEAGIFISQKFDALPAFQFQLQGKYRELNIGGAARYFYTADLALYGGFYYRNKDAGYLRVGVDYDNIHTSVTYDFNTSSLRPASNSRGGIEVGIVYIFKQFRPKFVKHKICPNYI
ncbi:MAG: PorP/SprF family type IX secretion system membrane protein [Bacteroidetes bacterium]|nr:type IX secretion system membrane protein PorP/SprF [Bacteroidota bacterium]MBV6461591.1 hypothetical protein [Flavobacteriales bacterium]WKZ74071.1 MAG: PorP/SprF family type IX secretion system membrane protein [Vicingaceae bacterium]MCL4817205.1 PorP/SprF family type IX secretion system membrane protein [Flavobacteriales bacterium]NOG95840.1 PorP/SprF family type IX secretion system membrane protein [Bacteroidota bacterium]